MLDYLQPKNGPVFPGLEWREIVYAKDQPQYIPLRTLVSDGPERKVISRWTLTEEQRKAILDGADIFLELSTYSQPLQPIRMIVCDGKTNDSCPMSTDWVEVCLLDSKPTKLNKKEGN